LNFLVFFKTNFVDKNLPFFFKRNLATLTTTITTTTTVTITKHFTIASNKIVSKLEFEYVVICALSPLY
jgi:hypothetical protein